MDAIKIETSSIVTAFQPRGVIGSKIGFGKKAQFMAELDAAVAAHDTSTERVPGQAFVRLGERANDMVTAGVGRRVDDPSAYAVRTHRGRCSAYLTRDYAEPVTGVACVVYSMAAYGLDPEVSKDEVATLEASGATHVLVAVIAFAGPASPLSPLRFVSNLAGGNKEAEVWTADEIRAKATEIYDYDCEWCAVAD